MDFSLDELIRHPTKKMKTQKRRDSDEAEAGKESTVVVSEAPASLEGIMEEVPRLPTREPEVGNPIREVEAALPTHGY